jgi:hypothetical protein
VRFLTAFAGILLSVPPLIFFWIGSQTFVRPLEKGLAVAVTLETGALLVMSIALFFTPSVQRIQTLLLAATAVTVAVIIFMAGRPHM